LAGKVWTSFNKEGRQWAARTRHILPTGGG